MNWQGRGAVRGCEQPTTKGKSVGHLRASPGVSAHLREPCQSTVGFARMPQGQLINDAKVLQAYQGTEGSVPVAPTAAEIQAYTRMLNQPGEIQPHGFFLLLHENEDGSRIVKACSENVTQIFGRPPSEAIPQPPSNLSPAPLPTGWHLPPTRSHQTHAPLNLAWPGHRIQAPHNRQPGMIPTPGSPCG